MPHGFVGGDGRGGAEVEAANFMTNRDPHRSLWTLCQQTLGQALRFAPKYKGIPDLIP